MGKAAVAETMMSSSQTALSNEASSLHSVSSPRTESSSRTTSSFSSPCTDSPVLLSLRRFVSSSLQARMDEEHDNNLLPATDQEIKYIDVF